MLTAGFTVGIFTGVESTSDDRLFEVEKGQLEADGKSANREVLSGHLKAPYETVKGSCSGLEEARKLVGLL